MASFRRLGMAFALSLNAVLAATTISIAAEAVKASTSAAGVPYFDYEKQQLTDDVLASYTSSIASFFQFGNTSQVLSSTNQTKVCRLLPGDAAWPSSSVWSTFNTLLGGGLIEGVPAAAACFEDWPQYDADTCAEIQDSWTDPSWMATQPTGIDWPINEGMSCLAPGLGDYISRGSGVNSTCTMGGLAEYIVNVTTVAQVQLAVNFARNQNLRLVVKNSGHDFNAKSTGAGALSVWTHYLNEIQYLGANHTSSTGNVGPAFKIGSGVSMEQMYDAADAEGLMVVGGIARTIGISGGYVAGGGNGPLINKYGMAADQVLSLEVVLPNGTFVSADENTNSDLYFALRGGGGGTWGVVTSVVLRAYENEKIAGLTYSFGSDIEQETFWYGIDAMWTYFSTWPEAGIWSYFSISCTDTVDCSLSMDPQLGIGMTIDELKVYTEPFIANLTALGINVTTSYTQYTGYLDMFESVWPSSSSTCSYWYFHSTSRLFPISNWANATVLANQSAVIRNTTQTRGQFIGYNSAPATNARVNQDNAVNPAWREALMFGQANVVYGANYTFDDIASANKEMVDALQTWRDITPGTYLNEADINEPDFQQSFYGDHYDRLYVLKQEFDPWGLLYAIGAVGSEDWYTTNQIAYYPTTNGRLCPV